VCVARAPILFLIRSRFISPKKSFKRVGAHRPAHGLLTAHACCVLLAPIGASPLVNLPHESEAAASAGDHLHGHNRPGTSRTSIRLVLLTERPGGPPLCVPANGSGSPVRRRTRGRSAVPCVLSQGSLSLSGEMRKATRVRHYAACRLSIETVQSCRSQQAVVDISVEWHVRSISHQSDLVKNTS
jgi:hypothetical protein